MSNILILSDIHGNLSALSAVLQVEHISRFDGIILLGDIIDYGPHSNEVSECLQRIPDNMIVASIWGNHEYSILNEQYEKFSSERGRECAKSTKGKLHGKTIEYLRQMEDAGKLEFVLDGRKCLAVHGSLEDCYWGSISHEEAGEIYSKYDIVFSGHSHIPHYFIHCYNGCDEKFRYKKPTIFLNPGSVGQPRNHNPKAHYMVLNTEDMSVHLCAIPYDIKAEMDCFSKEVDIFYKERLMRGI